MNIKKIIDNYVECNTFEIKIIGKKVKVYYYENIESFTSNTVVITSGNDIVKINGKNLVIETMFEEYAVISGNIKSLELGSKHE